MGFVSHNEAEDHAFVVEDEAEINKNAEAKEMQITCFEIFEKKYIFMV